MRLSAAGLRLDSLGAYSAPSDSCAGRRIKGKGRERVRKGKKEKGGE